jgi:hypothetical protein
MKYDGSPTKWKMLFYFENTGNIATKSAPLVYNNKLYILYSFNGYVYLARVNTNMTGIISKKELYYNSSSPSLYYNVGLFEDNYVVYAIKVDSSYYTRVFDLESDKELKYVALAINPRGNINKETLLVGNTDVFTIEKDNHYNRGLGKLNANLYRIFNYEDGYYWILKDNIIYKAKIYKTIKTKAISGVDIIVPDNAFAISDNIEINGNVCKVLSDGEVEIGVYQTCE